MAQKRQTPAIIICTIATRIVINLNSNLNAMSIALNPVQVLGADVSLADWCSPRAFFKRIENWELNPGL